MQRHKEKVGKSNDLSRLFTWSDNTPLGVRYADAQTVPMSPYSKHLIRPWNDASLASGTSAQGCPDREYVWRSGHLPQFNDIIHLEYDNLDRVGKGPHVDV